MVGRGNFGRGLGRGGGLGEAALDLCRQKSNLSSL